MDNLQGYGPVTFKALASSFQRLEGSHCLSATLQFRE